MKRTLAAACLALASLVTLAQAAHAFPTGISTSFLGASGCNDCHAGGTTPTVSLAGPTTVTAGTINEYLFVIDSPAGQLSGGFNASSLLGDLSVGGSEGLYTRIITSGDGGNNDVTHLAVKAGDGTDVRFSFLWEAPSSAGPATLDVWGNAVNANGAGTGDAAAFTSLTVLVEAAAPPSVPVTSPWAQASLVALLLGMGCLVVQRRRSLFG